MSGPSLRPHRVAVLALPGVVPYELGVPSRIFAAANTFDGTPLYEVLSCALDELTVPTAFDFTITVSHGVEILSSVDTLIIPTVHGEFFDGPLLAQVVALLRQVRPDTRIVTFCTASYLLAAAGLLDGQAAATHWGFADQLQREFPQIKVDADALYVDNGDILTSAGASAAQDLCLHLVRRDYGSEVANHAARICVVPPWRDGGQAQYIERPIPPASISSTAPTREWALANLWRPLSLEELARHARMSRRTFTRRFRVEVGLSPRQWITRQRIELARQLLESTDLTVEQIARKAGFSTAVALRQSLRAAMGVSPAAYRKTFQRAEPVAIGSAAIDQATR